MNGKFPKRFQCVCARIDLLFIIFVCSLYSPWATIRLLHHFVFVRALILAYSVRIFRAVDAKYVLFRVGWRNSLKGSATPAAFFQFTVSQRRHVFVQKWLWTLWLGQPASVVCPTRRVLYSECKKKKASGGCTPWHPSLPPSKLFSCLPSHILVDTVLYTHVEHSPTKTIYIKYYMEKQTHTLHLTVAETGYWY